MRHRQFNDKCISIETNVGCRFQQFVSKISVIDVPFAGLVDADSGSLRYLSAPAERHHATEDEESPAPGSFRRHEKNQKQCDVSRENGPGAEKSDRDPTVALESEGCIQEALGARQTSV